MGSVLNCEPTTPLIYQSCSVLPLSLPSWLSPWLSPLDPQPHTTPLPHTMPPPPLLITMKPQNLMLSNTESRMTTPELTSTPKKPLTAKLSLDLTKLLFPMVVSKPLPIPLITTTAMSLMSNTKVSQSTQKPNLTTLPQPPNTTPPPNTPQSMLKLFLR